MLLTNAREPYGCLKPGWPCFLNHEDPDDREIDLRITGPHNPDVRCGHYVTSWIEYHCVATQGHWAQQAAGVLDWERDYFIELFSVDPATGLRRYRWSLLGTPKKSGKTEICGWLGNYGLVGDEEPSPWIGVAASADHQADLVYGATKRCAEWSPTLSQTLDTYEAEIEVPSVPGAKLKRLSAKAGTNDGPSWHMLLLDELHTWEGKKGRDLWTVLTNGVGARRQPLILQITTAGVDLDDTICGEQYELGRRLVEDPELDPRYLFWWYQADLEEDAQCPRCQGDVDQEHRGCWRSVSVWKDANPSWGFTLPDPEAYLQDQVTKKRESEFKRYFLNLWVPAEDAWLPDGAWDRCAADSREPPLAVKFKTSLPLYVGVDGGLKRDSFAITAVQRQGDLVVVQSKVWENPYPSDHSLRDSWKLDLDAPLNMCRDLYEQFQEPAVITDTEIYPGPAFAYDPHLLEYAAQTLEGDGLNMVEVPQTDARMCPPSDLLYQLITQQRLVHDGDPELTRHIHAAVAKETARGWRLTRPRGARRHIDAATALVTALSVAFQPGYEDYEELEGPGLW